MNKEELEEFMDSLNYDPPWDVTGNYGIEEWEELFRLARLGAFVEANGYTPDKLLTPMNVTISYINKDKQRKENG